MTKDHAEFGQSNHGGMASVGSDGMETAASVAGRHYRGNSNDGGAGALLIILAVICVIAAPWFAPTIFVGGITFDAMPALLALIFTAGAFAGNTWLIFKAFQKISSKFIGALGGLELGVIVAFLFARPEVIHSPWRTAEPNILFAAIVTILAAAAGFFLFRWLGDWVKG